MKILLALALLGTCPLGPGETELTVSRVMRNFGRGTMAPEKIGRAVGYESSVTNADLQEAISGTQMAENCAAAVLDDPGEKLVPQKADEFSGREREAYLAKYYSHMREFASSLATLEQLLQRSLATPVASRNFSSIAAQVGEVKECATRAHGDL